MQAERCHTNGVREQAKNGAPVNGYRFIVSLEAQRVAEAEAVVEAWDRRHRALLASKVSGQRGRLTRSLELLVQASAGPEAIVSLERSLAPFGSYRRESCFTGFVVLDLAAAPDAVRRAKELVQQWNRQHGTAWSYAYRPTAEASELRASAGRFQVALSADTPGSAVQELSEALARLGPVREVNAPVL